MARHKKTVRQIAEASGRELDDVLISLWDAGFSWLKGPDDFLGSQELNRARRVLGVATRRELVSAEYWMKVLELDSAAFGELMASMKLKWGPLMHNVPDKSISRLRSHARSKGKMIGPTYQERAIPVVKIKVPKSLVRHDFQWAVIGKEVENIRFLQAREIEHMHRALVKDYRETSNPVDPPGVKSQTNLESAAFRPQTSNGNFRKYSSVQSSAAALAHSLTNNHAFHNGNKRTALVALIVHLYSNGYTLTCDDNQLFEIILRIAKHQVLTDELDEYHFDRTDEEVFAISKWIRDHSRPIEKGEKAISFGELVRLLNLHGCSSQNHGSGRFKTQFSRRVRGASLFNKPEEVRTVVPKYKDASHVPKSMTKRIREELKLDDENGFDAARFYGMTEQEPSVEDFILRYKGILNRLAKL